MSFRWIPIAVVLGLVVVYVIYVIKMVLKEK